MPDHTDYAILLLTASVVALLGVAAWRDVATRTIPDTISLALIGVGLVARASQGWSDLGASVLMALAVFFVLLPFQARGFVGGADLKLLAALAVGLPPMTSLHLIATVTFFGGGLAAVYILLRRLVPLLATLPHPIGRRGSLARRVAAVETWRIYRRAPLPYGVAIAAGAAFTILQQSGV